MAQSQFTVEQLPGPQTEYCPGKDLSNFRHGNLTPDRGIKHRNYKYGVLYSRASSVPPSSDVILSS